MMYIVESQREAETDKDDHRERAGHWNFGKIQALEKSKGSFQELRRKE